MAPAQGALGKLLVFLPGINYRASQESAFLHTAVAEGYHTIGLAYPNSRGANFYCKNSKGLDCHGGVRREIVFGENSTSLFALPAQNAIVPRLVAELQNLSESPGDAGWGTFLLGDQPAWDRIAVAGHSQGSGNAAILGIDREVARVILLAGPNDLPRGTDAPPRWVTSVGAKTPQDRWFGLTHVMDDEFFIQEQVWDLFGLPGDDVVNDVPAGGHRLITTLKTDDPHLSVVVDDELVGGTANPKLTPSWKHLLSAP
ncbi:MAG: hypothetical protein M3N45_04305 [Actinomycetota bacterium]|nr:hypothetical protein [Actinomycetota bacterium]